MIDGIHATSAERPRPLVAPVTRADGARTQGDVRHTPVSIPATPPPEVLEALNTAAEVIEQLEAQQLSLHFEIDENKKLTVQMVDRDGEIVREIPARTLASLLAGVRPGDHVFDVLG